jgi:Zn2+/Cd2+-exporting ATPase
MRFTGLGLSVTFTTLTLLGTAVGFVARSNGWPELPWWVLAFVFGGIPAGLKALTTLWQERKLDVDMLMVVAALGAASVGQAGEGAILLFLFSLSNTLQDWAIGSTKRAIEALMRLNPEGAYVLEGEEVWKRLEDIKPGDLLVVKPGERFAADGIVETGYSEADESALTGESVPIDKKPGDPIQSGSLNGQGALRVRVSKPASESTLAKLIGLVETARAAKSQTERFAERFEGPYTLAVLLSAPVVFAVAHYIFGLEVAAAWYRAMTFLVVASPCAVVIATPAAVLSAMAAGARGGVLFKSGAALESLSKVTAIALDKTGTLTKGQMELVQTIPLNTTREEALALAASLERSSEHPFAKAITRSFKGPLPDVTGFQGIRGKGAIGQWEGKTVWIGNRSLSTDQQASLTPEATAQLNQLEEEGLTTAILGIDQKALALLAVADVVRPEATEAVSTLPPTWMLTGDRLAVAQHIAKQVGIKNVKAQLLPEDKLRFIQALSREQPTAMVGDGVNDAPALNAATVGISMATGSDVSLESADIVLMRNDLRSLSSAISLARATSQTVWFNLSFALAIIVVVGGFALAGQIPLPLGVIAHEGGTVFVVLVGLRLLFYKV